jgi:hypothetical protein
MDRDAQLSTDHLAAADRARKRAYLSFILVWCATVGSLLWFAFLVRRGADANRIMSAAVVSLVFAICMAAFGVMFFVARMTMNILAAIGRRT